MGRVIVAGHWAVEQPGLSAIRPPVMRNYALNGSTPSPTAARSHKRTLPVWHPITDIRSLLRSPNNRLITSRLGLNEKDLTCGGIMQIVMGDMMGLHGHHIGPQLKWQFFDGDFRDNR